MKILKYLSMILIGALAGLLVAIYLPIGFALSVGTAGAFVLMSFPALAAGNRD